MNEEWWVQFTLIMCRLSSRVMYASGLHLEYETMMPLSPATALDGCSWSVHLASLLPLLSSQDGSTGVMGTQLISMSGTCRKWPAMGLPLMLVVRRYACIRGIYDVWQYVMCMYTTVKGDLSSIHPLREWYNVIVVYIIYTPNPWKPCPNKTFRFSW